ncbi:hypothetical protein PSPO01_12333 [Paraphaeosphaeria sporulosa]
MHCLRLHHLHAIAVQPPDERAEDGGHQEQRQDQGFVVAEAAHAVPRSPMGEGWEVGGEGLIPLAVRGPRVDWLFLARLYRRVAGRCVCYCRVVGEYHSVCRDIAKRGAVRYGKVEGEAAPIVA